jgi:DNA recombination protein RmuC
MSSEIVLILVFIVIGFGAVYFALRHLMTAQKNKEMESLVQSAFGKSAQVIAEQSKLILQSEKDVIATDMAHRHKSIEELVVRLQNDLGKQQAEIRLLEQDRSKKFGELVSSLDSHRKLTDELNISTKRLSQVLSNNQARGEWGERIIEDLLQANGLMEGIHYERQKKLSGLELRPDITLLLPNHRIVAVDVKFPYAEMQKLLNADTKDQKQQHLKQFHQDLKSKIIKVAEYIQPGSDTLDYAILFVPNEMVFSFINQQLSEIIDFAMSKRVLLVSPFTFLIVAKTVHESYRNFMVSDSLRSAVATVEDFVGEWDKFKEHIAKYGRTIQTLQSDYEQLTGARVRQLDKKVEKVLQYSGNSLIDEVKADKKLEAPDA